MDKNYLTDEELAVLAKTDNLHLEQLLIRYVSVVKKIASKYYVKGYDEEDLKQEGRLSLVRAVKLYDGQSSFKNYASKCIKNSVLTLIKKANRLKNLPLKDYVSLSGLAETDDADKNKILSTKKLSPEEDFIEKEKATELFEKIKINLSAYEFTVFSLYLDGYSYEEIKNRVNKDVKSIDNAIQRARKKLEFIKRN